MCQLPKWSFKWTDWYSHVSFSSDGSWLATACFRSSVVALVPVEDQHGLGTASGGAATSAANTVTPTFHTTPKRFVVRIVREVSETLGKVTPPSRKECNHLVDARTGMAEEIPRTHFC